MIETPYAAFLTSTAGRFTVIGSSFVWCASPTLCGAFLWGAPTESETRDILHVFDQYPTQMARSFDIVLDSRGVEHVDAAGLALVARWLHSHGGELAKHLRMQANVIRQGPIGLLLTGLLPVTRWPCPYRIDYDPRDAFRSIAGEEGIALCAEIEAIAERLLGVPRELRLTRELLADRPNATIDEVSRALGTSERSLQRALSRVGSSFHREVVDARLRHAQQLLRSTDQKVATVAAQIGVSSRSLSGLFRSRTDLSPSAWRKRERR